MTPIITFYLSRVIGVKVLDINENNIGIVKDLLIDPDPSNHVVGRPFVKSIKIKCKKQIAFYSFQDFQIKKVDGKIKINCNQLIELSPDNINYDLYLADAVLDKQIADLNGHKLVRVNDIRLVSIIDDVIENLINKRRTNK